MPELEAAALLDASLTSLLEGIGPRSGSSGSVCIQTQTLTLTLNPSLNPDSSAPAQIYNLGNTNPHTVTELVDLLERGLNRKAQRNLVPMPATGDVLATFADISAAKAVRPAATGRGSFGSTAALPWSLDERVLASSIFRSPRLRPGCLQQPVK